MRRALARRRRPHDERGSAIVELVWLGVLLLVPMVWVVITLFQVQGGAFAATTAARSAGRAFALAPTDAQGEVAARQAARQALDDQGLDGVPVTVHVSCTPYPDQCHSGTSIITVRIDTAVTLPLLPDVLGSGRPRFALDATHTVPIGQYQEITGAAAE